MKLKKIARKLRTLLRAAVGRDLLVRPDVIVQKKRFGSEYGGWDIVAAELDSDSVVYSIGIGEDASFDVALIDKWSLTVHAFDPTPKSIEWVRKQGFSNKFVMHNYGIAAFDGDVSFNPPENPDHVSHTILDRPATKAKSIAVPVKRISTTMQELGHDHIDVIKMDIEGAEYDVIEDLDKSNIRPGQILIEFHHRFPGIGVKKTRESISRIRSMGYLLFSISDTNEEFCFIRRSI